MEREGAFALSRRDFTFGGALFAGSILTACGGEKSSGPVAAAAPPPPLKTNIVTESGPPIVRPASRWNGQAGTGFNAVPRDPERTTAKPACRLLIPPRQRFAEALLVGVLAMASNQGSMLETLGLEKVVVHFEGGRVDIEEPTIATMLDANGNEVSYLGWWARLGTTETFGEGHVYFEAVPRDTSMQRRVIGPYSFFPAETPHDMQLTVAPSRAEVPGERYRTCKSAVRYAYSAGAQHPRIVITESGGYAIDFWLAQAWINGWVTIETQRGVTARFAQTGTFSEADLPRMSAGIRTRFRGAGISLDFCNTAELNAGQNVEYWFDGCTLTNSAGPNSLWRKLPRSLLGFTVRGEPWHTESRIANLFNPLDTVSLARGVFSENTLEDYAQGAFCVVGCRSVRHSSDHFRTYNTAMRLHYSGTASATIESTSPGRTLLFKEDGAIVGMMPLSASGEVYQQSPEGSSAGTFHVSNVVAWVNSALPGWHATLLDDSRAGVALSLAGARAAQIVPTSVTDQGLELYTHFDLHGDFYQRANDAEVENVIFYGNVAIAGSFQTLFMGSPNAGFIRDAFFVNNAWHHDPGSSFAADTLMGSFGGNPSHVVIAHNSVANQSVRLTDPAKSSIGRYNVFACNVVSDMKLEGAPLPSVEIFGNHQQAGTFIPAGAVASSVGGTADTNFRDAAAGDFSPTGELLANPIAPRIGFDLAGNVRGSNSARGALAG